MIPNVKLSEEAKQLIKTLLDIPADAYAGLLQLPEKIAALENRVSALQAIVQQDTEIIIQSSEQLTATGELCQAAVAYTKAVEEQDEYGVEEVTLLMEKAKAWEASAK